MPTATIRLPTPPPNMATNRSASSSEGKANSTSRNRLIIVSAPRPASPAAKPSTMAMARPTAVAATPISRDSRAPKTTRLNTSRPDWSVPNRWLSEGPCRVFAGLMASGASLAIRPGQTIATSRKARTSQAGPAPGLSSLARPPSRTTPGCWSIADGTLVTVMGALFLYSGAGRPQARVDELVEDVDEDRRDDVDHGDDQHDADGQRHVLLRDALQEDVAETVTREQRLHDDRAADE